MPTERLLLHAIDPTGNLVAQDARLDVPAAQWRPDDTIVKQHTLTLPDDPPVTLTIGVYHPQTFQRLFTEKGEDATILE
jgi:hypothetical protein